MQGRPSLARLVGLGSLWGAVAAALVAGFAALASGLALAIFAVTGTELGEVERAVWLGVVERVAGTALAPLGTWTVIAWCVVVAVRPSADAAWRRVGPGVVALAAAGFPAVGAFVFTSWTAGTALDYLATWLLVAGGVSLALLLARRLVPPLAPGAFGGRGKAPPAG